MLVLGTVLTGYICVCVFLYVFGHVSVLIKSCHSFPVLLHKICIMHVIRFLQ